MTSWNVHHPLDQFGPKNWFDTTWSSFDDTHWKRSDTLNMTDEAFISLSLKLKCRSTRKHGQGNYCMFICTRWQLVNLFVWLHKIKLAGLMKICRGSFVDIFWNDLFIHHYALVIMRELMIMLDMVEHSLNYSCLALPQSRTFMIYEQQCANTVQTCLSVSFWTSLDVGPLEVLFAWSCGFVWSCLYLHRTYDRALHVW